MGPYLFTDRMKRQQKIPPPKGTIGYTKLFGITYIGIIFASPIFPVRGTDHLIIIFLSCIITSSLPLSPPSVSVFPSLTLFLLPIKNSPSISFLKMNLEELGFYITPFLFLNLKV